MADVNTPEVTEQTEQLDTATTETSTEPAQDESKTFTADYVSELRNEAKGHREKSQALAAQLHTELVRQSGRLADPTELPYDAAHLDDPDALKVAIDELLARKPHYAARTPNGHVGQGVKDQGEPANWLTDLKQFV